MPYRWIITYDANEEEKIEVCSTLNRTLDIVNTLKVDEHIAESLAVHLEVITEDGSHSTFGLPPDIDVVHDYHDETEEDVVERLLEEDPIFSMIWNSPVFFN